MKKTQTVTKRKKIRFDHYLDLVSFREKPISDQSLEKLAKDLVAWAINDETATKIKPFFIFRGMGTTDVKRWKKRNKKFAAAYSLALSAIGNRREHGALTKKYDSNTVIKSMPLYDSDWKDLEEWRSNLRKSEQENKATTFTIKMDSFKDKKDKDGK